MKSLILCCGLFSGPSAAVALAQATPPTPFFECGIEKLTYRYEAEIGQAGRYYSPRSPEGMAVYAGTRTLTVSHCSEMKDTLIYISEFTGIRDSFVVPVDTLRQMGEVLRGFPDSSHFVREDSIHIVDTATCYYPFQSILDGRVKIPIECREPFIPVHQNRYPGAFVINLSDPSRFILSIDTARDAGRSLTQDTSLADTSVGVLKARFHHVSALGIGAPYQYFNASFDLLAYDGKPIDSADVNRRWIDLQSPTTANRKAIPPSIGLSLRGLRYDISGRRVRKSRGPVPGLILTK